MSIMDLRRLNSATKYPSIGTYHRLDAAGRYLTETVAVQFPPDATIYVTEKIDGANARIIIVPTTDEEADWFVGSREDLLTARGDRIANPARGIAAALAPTAKVAADYYTNLVEDWNMHVEGHGILPLAQCIVVIYGEFYGHKGDQPAWKTYNDTGVGAFACYDIAIIAKSTLDAPVEKIAAWRQAGGQTFLPELPLRWHTSHMALPLVPRLGGTTAQHLPTTLQTMADQLTTWAPSTRMHTTHGGGGPAEGVVLRTEDRAVIVKARHGDYHRSIKHLSEQGAQAAVGLAAPEATVV